MITVIKRNDFALLVQYGLNLYRIAYGFKNLGAAEETIADYIGLSVRTLRIWKHQDSAKRLAIRNPDALLSFIYLILRLENGWESSEKTRINWFVNLLKTTSENLQEELDETYFKKFIATVKISGNLLTKDQLDKVSELLFKDNQHENIKKLIEISHEHFQKSRYIEALNYINRALTSAKDLNDLVLEANCFAFKGLILIFIGEYELAHTEIQNALTIAKVLPSSYILAYATRNLGLWYESQAFHDDALHHYEHACTISQSLPNSKQRLIIQTNLLGDLGNEDVYRGNFKRALARYKLALKNSKKLNDHYLQSVHYGNIANVLDDIGEYDQALISYGQACATAEVAEDDYNLAVHHHNIGEILREHKQDFKKAKENFSLAMKITLKIGDINGHWEALRGLAKTHLMDRNYIQAKINYEKALRFAQYHNQEGWIEITYDELNQLKTENE